METTSVDSFVLSDVHTAPFIPIKDAPLYPADLTGNRKERFHTIHS